MCRWVFPWSLDSLASALGVVGYMRDLCVHSRAYCGSLSSSGDVGFTRVCPGGRWVDRGSLASLARALGFVGSIRGRWVHSVGRWGYQV